MNHMISGCGVDLPNEEYRRARCLPYSSRRTLAFSALISASSWLVAACLWPPSTWAWTTQRRTDSLPTPSCLATRRGRSRHRRLLTEVVIDQPHSAGLQLIIDLLGRGAHPP
jgi:hypothetical protein